MTFLRWAGSKKQILAELSSCWYASTTNTPHNKQRYIEGFSGSAALFFHLQPPSAILIDVNEELQNCMLRVKLEPKGVYLALKQWENHEAEYYRVRAMDKSKMKPNERAAIFIYLNRLCFNGLYRTNKKGDFNVPFGGFRTGPMPGYKQLLAASNILQSAEIKAGDFYEIIESIALKEDFVYLDPPYAMRNATLDNQYGPDVFGIYDIARLGRLLEILCEKGTRFVVSYAECDEIKSIASKWNYYKVEVRRSIAADSNKRGKANEIIFTNI